VSSPIGAASIFSRSSATNYPINDRSSQIFDVNHLQECLRTSHICSGGRLELVIDSENSSGLFHKNGLKCSVCNKVTDLTNFLIRPLFEIQEPNQRLYAAGAISGIGYDATRLIFSMMGLHSPHRSNFFKQTHQL
jgi:hypothetical protein